MDFTKLQEHNNTVEPISTLTRKNFDISLESPYTSLGSRTTSYNSMLMSNVKENTTTATHDTTKASTNNSNLMNGNYLSLRAKAEEGHAKYESRTKAVMTALQSLQSKIRKIETDRTNAELNLKCLALETKDYKELLKQKHLDGSAGILKDSQSQELENQLDHAQTRCEILEKQLESMRKMMTIHSTSPGRNVQPRTTPSKGVSPYKSFNESLTADTSAIEKLHDLEKEHERITVTQSLTEEKITMLEEKLRKEAKHRKMLQDKTRELQNVLVTKQKVEHLCTPTQQTVKKVKRKKKVPRPISPISVKIPSTEKTPSLKTPPPRPMPLNASHSPSHYLVDFSNIPFVVGQSTSKSHALGANIQSVLSIMKSHNMLCGDDSPRLRRSAHTKCTSKESELLASCAHLQELLTTLQDEFAQLGFEHREIISRLKLSSNARNTRNLEKERDKATERMEAKAKQIRIIQDHLEKVQTAENDKKRQRRRKNSASKTKRTVPAVEVASTSRRSPELKANPNLDMLKKVKKLQTTLCKDDLKWV